MRKLRKLIMIISIGFILVPGTALFAEYDLTKVEKDIEVITKSLSNLFGQNLGSISFIGDPVGYSIIPHFEIGAAGGLVFVPLDNIGLDASLDYNFGDFAYAPIPSIGAHAKVTIKRFEVGAKVAGMPPFQVKEDEVEGQINNFIFGGKLRYRLVDKKLVLLHFGVSVGGFFEYARGSASLRVLDSFEVNEDVNGDGLEEHIADVTTDAGTETNWSGSTFGAEAQANMKILIFNIFGGTRISKSFGKATTDFDGSTTLTAQPGFDVSGDVVPFTDQTISVSSEAKPEGIDYALFGGLEVKILPLAIGARGSYNFKNENITLDVGARLQF